jgi:hypothetical protein
MGLLAKIKCFSRSEFLLVLPLLVFARKLKSTKNTTITNKQRKFLFVLFVQPGIVDQIVEPARQLARARIVVETLSRQGERIKTKTTRLFVDRNKQGRNQRNKSSKINRYNKNLGNNKNACLELLLSSASALALRRAADD